MNLAQLAWSTGQRVSGQILELDFNFKSEAEIDFTNAAVIGLEIPTLDAASRTGADATLWLRAESEQWRAGSGTPVSVSPKQKKWQPSNFRLTISGLEEACKRINKIEAFTIKQKVAGAPAGMQRASLSSAGWEPSTVAFTLPASDVKGFSDWLKVSVAGEVNRAAGRSAVVELLAPDLKTVLATLRGSDVSIRRVTAAPLTGSPEADRWAMVELSVGSWQLSSGAGASGR